MNGCIMYYIFDVCKRQKKFIFIFKQRIRNVYKNIYHVAVGLAFDLNDAMRRATHMPNRDNHRRTLNHFVGVVCWKFSFRLCNTATVLQDYFVAILVAHVRKWKFVHSRKWHELLISQFIYLATQIERDHIICELSTTTTACKCLYNSCVNIYYEYINSLFWLLHFTLWKYHAYTVRALFDHIWIVRTMPTYAWRHD